MGYKIRLSRSSRDLRSAQKYRAPENGGIDENPVGIFGNSGAGTVVNKKTALGLSAVYACVDRISGSIAALPFNVYSDVDGVRSRIPDHPVAQVLRNPGNGQIRNRFLRDWITGALLMGRSAVEQLRDANGSLVGFRQIYERLDEYFLDDGTRYYANKITGKYYLPEDLLILECIEGKSPLKIHMENLGLALAAQTYGAKYFESGGGRFGVLETDKILKDDQHDRIRRDWRRRYARLEMSGETPILEAGLKYKRFTVPPDEAQFIETRKLQIEEIARIYSVPLPLIQAEGAMKYNNLDALLRLYAQFGLVPWIQQVEEEMMMKLLRRDEIPTTVIEADLRALMRGDAKTRAEYLDALGKRGYITVNEARISEGWNPVEGGDVHIIQSNQISLDYLEAFSKKLSDPESAQNTGNDGNSQD